MILPFFTSYCTRLRDRFADAALSSLMFHEPETKDPKALADRANQIAEAMMERRGKKPTPEVDRPFKITTQEIEADLHRVSFGPPIQIYDEDAGDIRLIKIWIHPNGGMRLHEPLVSGWSGPFSLRQTEKSHKEDGPIALFMDCDWTEHEAVAATK